MIDMSGWEEMPADVVDDLHLDPHNVRLDLEPDQEVPESDIIQDLVRNEKVLSLIEAISQIGYLTHEVPIVVRRNRQMFVVEGNRRVAALKLIQNPYLAIDHQARVNRIIQVIPDRDSLKKIIVKVAPDQDAADQLIAALHTSNPRRPWSPSRQAAFFQAQVDTGKTVKQLLAQYPTIDVKEFVVRSQILALFRAVKYSNPELADYVSGRRFPVSTLARLYENDKFLELAQIKVNGDRTKVSIVGGSVQFGVLAEKIIGDIKEKRINTRVLNTARSDTYVEYMDELREFADSYIDTAQRGQARSANSGSEDGKASSGTDAPSRNNHGSPSSSAGTSSSDRGQSGQSDEQDDDSKPEEETNRSQQGRERRIFLDTENLQVPATFPQPIHAIFYELSRINITRFPNATLDLLRTFLEKTIKAYADSLNEEIKDTSNQTGYVYLSDALKWLESHVKNIGKRAFVQVIVKIRAGRLSGYVSSMDHLNAINHNHHISASAEDARECWNTMKGLLSFILKP